MIIQKQIEFEMQKRNEEFTQKFLSGTAKIVDMTIFETDDYQKCRGKYAEIIDGRMRVAYVHCPKCREFISIYKDEILSIEGQTKIKKHLCGFYRPFLLKKWNKR